MFSTLNKQARPVSKAELIALDEDDPSAIVARRIATRYDGLNRSCSPPAGTGRRGRSSWGLIHLGKGNQIPQSNTYSITTIVTLLDVVRSAFKGELNRLNKEYGGNRPSEFVRDQLYDESVAVWQHLGESCDELADVMGSDPAEERAAQDSSIEGGHMLFRPIGQQTFAGALGLLKSRGIATDRAIAHLCQAPMQLSEPPGSR